MTLVEERPVVTQLNRRPEPAPDLRVERTDIAFTDVPGDKVRILVTVHNDGLHRSPPAPLTLESAPLGAFVPWRPLAMLSVPPLEPGQSHQLSVDVARPRPVPLGNFDRVPPARLLTALMSPDAPVPQRGGGLTAMLDLLRRSQPARPPTRPTTGNSLAPDMWDLLGRGQPHWAGNINVFIGRHAVERHLAQALRIYPGRTNLAMFVVGSAGNPDAYAFELVGLPSDWEAALVDARTRNSFVIKASDPRIESKQWVETYGGLLVMLAVHPPADCKTGHLEVQVTRRSTGKTAVVEFDLSPTAQGAGCYCV